MKCCLLVWAFTTCLQAFAGYWGRCMLFSFSGSILPAFRPCWMSGETSAVSLSGPLLPARGAYCRKLREIYAVLLVWVSTTSFQTLLDVGGNVCRLLVWAFTTCSRGLLQDNEGEVCRLLVSSPVFTMASPWKFYLRLFGTKFS